jgi:hypothetical protein
MPITLVYLSTQHLSRNIAPMMCILIEIKPGTDATTCHYDSSYKMIKLGVFMLNLSYAHRYGIHTPFTLR